MERLYRADSLWRTLYELMQGGSYFSGLFKAYASYSLATRFSSVFSGFQVSRVDRDFFTVHEDYLVAVALTGCARGDHTHQLASNFLVQSSTALRLLAGELVALY